ncbi:Protein F58E6.13 b [Aphelenchoides avenae]|nr:Protein F58E6.13 b [Aphelenchus avenae]
MRKSVLASLRFVNKHWIICGESESWSADNRTADCGKLQVTGEVISSKTYRINATFVAQRDPIKNTKVDATSTVYGVVQIGLRGGIFQYTNAMKALGKPSAMDFEEAFFCYPGHELVQQDKCRRKARQQHTRQQRHALLKDATQLFEVDSPL